MRRDDRATSDSLASRQLSDCCARKPEITAKKKDRFSARWLSEYVAEIVHGARRTSEATMLKRMAVVEADGEVAAGEMRRREGEEADGHHRWQTYHKTTRDSPRGHTHTWPVP